MIENKNYMYQQRVSIWLDSFEIHFSKSYSIQFIIIYSIQFAIILKNHLQKVSDI